MDRIPEGRPQLGATDKLAFDRTRAAYNRSMQATVRTGTTLITFGFSVYKFFELERTGRAPLAQFIGPREFALVAILLGVLSIILGMYEYRRDMGQVRAQYPESPRSSAGFVAGMTLILGLLALIAVLVRV